MFLRKNIMKIYFYTCDILRLPRLELLAPELGRVKKELSSDFSSSEEFCLWRGWLVEFSLHCCPWRSLLWCSVQRRNLINSRHIPIPKQEIFMCYIFLVILICSYSGFRYRIRYTLSKSYSTELIQNPLAYLLRNYFILLLCLLAKIALAFSNHPF